MSEQKPAQPSQPGTPQSQPVAQSAARPPSQPPTPQATPPAPPQQQQQLPGAEQEQQNRQQQQSGLPQQAPAQQLPPQAPSPVITHQQQPNTAQPQQVHPTTQSATPPNVQQIQHTQGTIQQAPGIIQHPTGTIHATGPIQQPLPPGAMSASALPQGAIPLGGLPQHTMPQCTIPIAGSIPSTGPIAMNVMENGTLRTLGQTVQVIQQPLAVSSAGTAAYLQQLYNQQIMLQNAVAAMQAQQMGVHGSPRSPGHQAGVMSPIPPSPTTIQMAKSPSGGPPMSPGAATGPGGSPIKTNQKSPTANQPPHIQPSPTMATPVTHQPHIQQQVMLAHPGLPANMLGKTMIQRQGPQSHGMTQHQPFFIQPLGMIASSGVQTSVPGPGAQNGANPMRTIAGTQPQILTSPGQGQIRLTAPTQLVTQSNQPQPTMLTSPTVLSQLQAMAQFGQNVPLAPGQIIGTQSPTILTNQPMFIRAAGPMQGQTCMVQSMQAPLNNKGAKAPGEGHSVRASNPASISKSGTISKSVSGGNRSISALLASVKQGVRPNENPGVKLPPGVPAPKGRPPAQHILPKQVQVQKVRGRQVHKVPTSTPGTPTTSTKPSPTTTTATSKTVVSNTKPATTPVTTKPTPTAKPVSTKTVASKPSPGKHPHGMLKHTTKTDSSLSSSSSSSSSSGSKPGTPNSDVPQKTTTTDSKANRGGIKSQEKATVNGGTKISEHAETPKPKVNHINDTSKVNRPVDTRKMNGNVDTHKMNGSVSGDKDEDNSESSVSKDTMEVDDDISMEPTQQGVKEDKPVGSVLGSPPTAVVPGERQKAIVKPQVLTHIIEGFVIQEGTIPFPPPQKPFREKNMKLDNGPPAKIAREEPQPKPGEKKEERIKCQFCGRVGLAKLFRRSKRFCTNACAKRYNVGCSRRLGLFKPDGHRKKRGRPPKSWSLSRASFEKAAKHAGKAEQSQKHPTPSSPKKKSSSIELGQSSSSGEHEDTESTTTDTTETSGLDNTQQDIEDSNHSHVESEVVDVDMEVREEVQQQEVQPENREEGPQPKRWTVEEVYNFIHCLPGCETYADEFRSQEIDGQALLLLKEDHLMSAMNIKLGPALKICAKINSLKDD